MLKDFAAYTIATVIGIAFLGVVALGMVKESLRDIDIAPPN
jgi:hypothetical protein